MAGLLDQPAGDLFLDGDIEFDGNASSFARGGFGQLFIGTTRRHGKVAMKCLTLFDKSVEKLEVGEIISLFGVEDTKDVDRQERLVKTLTEARVWRALSHKNVLPFLGVLFRGLDIYLVSPFVENGSLPVYLTLEPETDRILLLYQIADGLAFLNARGVVHGDVKGQNILIERGPRAILCDFGLAKIVSAKGTSTGHALGTVRWQSPELMEGGPRTFESDVYAFGITIYETLSGRLPFHSLPPGPGDAAIIVAVIIRDQRPAKDDILDIGEDIDAVWEIAENCWMRDPQSRHSITAIFKALACLRPNTAGDAELSGFAGQTTDPGVRQNAFLAPTPALVESHDNRGHRLGKRTLDQRDTRPDLSDRPPNYARSRMMNEIDSIETTTSQTILQRLAYSDGASWRMELVCAPDTRIGFLNDIQTWINQPASYGSPSIFVLSSVAGSGKSAVAHSVAQLSTEDPKCTLASSFFFDREVTGRNTPERFFSNLAVDLASHDPQCNAHMSRLLKGDPSLGGGSMKRLFDELIVPSVNASEHYSHGQPIVIVVDALDEGQWNMPSLQIIRDGALRLPGNFRFFLTSRPQPGVDHVFRSSADVRRATFDLASADNTSDIRVFVEQQCQSIAYELDLDARWPGQVRKEQLATKAEGLFVWIAVVFGYIRDPEKTCDPDDRLKSLLEDGEDIGLKPGEKMDRLFQQIVDSCPWEDRNFPAAFNLVIGTLVALEMHLSPAAFALYLGDGSEANIRRVRALSPLIAGLYGDGDTLRFIHLSVREFLTSRLSANTRHYVDKDGANQRLTLTCLDILNHDLPAQRVGVGYLKAKSKGVPSAPVDNVPEHLQYACNFWKIHASSILDPIPTDVHKMSRDLDLTSWLELSASLGQLQTLSNAPGWVQTCLIDMLDAEGAQISETYSNALYGIFARLNYDIRLEEAFEAINETVLIRAELAKATPGKFNPRLAYALHELSECARSLGKWEEALSAIQDAVKIRRELVKEKPAELNLPLADSLALLGIALSNLGGHEEALGSIAESVAVYRDLVKERPAESNDNFARSLNTLSNSLSDLGQKEESLSAIQEAVTISRTLTVKQPTLYNPDLASMLKNLSNRLSDLGRYEEALSIAEEGLAVHRELAQDQPAKFNLHLAVNLIRISNCLHHVGRSEEALSQIEESVTILRDLAKKRPAAFNDTLSVSLNHLSFLLSALGRHEEALEAAIKDVAIKRPLAMERPILFNARLKQSLENLSDCLSELGHEEEAKSAVEEAESLTS